MTSESKMPGAFPGKVPDFKGTNIARTIIPTVLTAPSELGRSYAASNGVNMDIVKKEEGVERHLDSKAKPGSIITKDVAPFLTPKPETNEYKTWAKEWLPKMQKGQIPTTPAPPKYSHTPMAAHDAAVHYDKELVHARTSPKDKQPIHNPLQELPNGGSVFGSSPLMLTTDAPYKPDYSSFAPVHPDGVGPSGYKGKVGKPVYPIKRPGSILGKRKDDMEHVLGDKRPRTGGNFSIPEATAVVPYRVRGIHQHTDEMMPTLMSRKRPNLEPHEGVFKKQKLNGPESVLGKRSNSGVLDTRSTKKQKTAFNEIPSVLGKRKDPYAHEGGGKRRKIGFDIVQPVLGKRKDEFEHSFIDAKRPRLDAPIVNPLDQVLQAAPIARRRATQQKIAPIASRTRSKTQPVADRTRSKKKKN